ncbi:sulfurtransferase [Streptomyces corynorhini]|uniref:thiosulfate sulfurtransferase n=1 Tax=Streptomyces corynorhini TaxID=2282652 RepID=A0A370AZ40_9ACTN|nr:rhodanese-like domain-containing protein [Streptomyces corynorhini]RDG34858.1 sulfurtransferase [Streptomyces corynorhini]
MRPVPAKAVTTSARKLADALRSGAQVVVLEVGREAGEGPEPRNSYLAGHLPGARFVSFEEDLVGPRTGSSGNSPLPRASGLQDRLRRWGVDDDSTVVVHTRQNPAVATRAWWTLRWAGVEDVRYLHGGLSGWRRIGGALDTDVPPPGAGSATVRPGSLPLLTAEEAGRLAASGHLIDARAAQAYRGDPDRTGTGHIPGAHSIPGADNFTGGELRDAAALTALYAAHLDGDEVGAYCGGGVSATTTVLALASLGVEAALYPGSWSAWITDPTRPIATGARPCGRTAAERPSAG